MRVVSTTVLQSQPVTAWLFIAARGSALVQRTFAASGGRGSTRTISQGVAHYSRYGERLTGQMPACSTTAQVPNVSLLRIIS